MTRKELYVLLKQSVDLEETLTALLAEARTHDKIIKEILGEPYNE